MIYVFRFATFFMIGSAGGWVVELFFRHFVLLSRGKNRWVNPGFLAGPCLPIYGFGLSILYFMSYFGDMLPIENAVLKAIVIVLSEAVVMTLVELIAGEIFIIRMKIRLWDYSRRRWNYKGIICPLFSAIWGLIGAAYYVFFHGWLPDVVDYLISQNYILFIFGVFYGIFFVDYAYSMQMVKKVKKFAEDNGIIVFYDDLKEDITASREQKKEKTEFTFVFRGNMQEHLKHYYEKMKLSAGSMAEKMQEHTEALKMQMQENADALKEKVQENTDAFKEKVQENTDHMKDKMQETSDSIKEKMGIK
ncbi:MAG: hypothetical protein IKE65_07905 [Clostridia bacterium]|nr:hypothetical protein [Clostridia bacterium]